MGRHDGRQPVVDETTIREEVLVQVRQLAVVYWQRDVRIRHHVTVSGEVLGGSRHASFFQAAHERDGQFRHGLGRTVKRTVADDFAGAEVEIHYRRERQVDANGPQFRTQQPAHLPRQMAARLPVAVPGMANDPHVRNARKPFAEALHAPAFVVDGHQQRRAAHGTDVAHQRRHLLGAFVVAREQDDGPDQRMFEYFAVFRGEPRTGHIDHQGSKRHPGFLSSAVHSR